MFIAKNFANKDKIPSNLMVIFILDNGLCFLSFIPRTLYLSFDLIANHWLNCIDVEHFKDKVILQTNM